MATLNPAEYFRLNDRGAIAPGRRADLVVFARLDDLRPERIYVSGELVAQEGQLLAEPRAPVLPDRVRDSVQISEGQLQFAIPAAGRRVRVIGVRPNQLLTDTVLMDARVVDGHAVADPERDLLKMAVVERHGRSGGAGLGFVRGFGLAHGALASTVAHDHHNLVVLGADDASMRTAARAVAAAGGGQAAALGEEVLALLPLPIAGLMSDQPIERVRDRLSTLNDAAQRLGSPLHEPLMTMSFLALEVIPELKLTDMGLVDVNQFALVPLFAAD
jgi:adenine deaminase